MNSSFIFAIIALFCFFNFSSQQMPGGYTPITTAEVYNDPNAEAALKFGANFVVANLTSTSVIPPGNYSVAEIISAAQQVVKGMNYQFEVEITNKAQTEVFDALYVVFRDLNGNQQVNSWSYTPPNYSL